MHKAINSRYILVEKVEETVKEGFQVAAVQDNFVYKGRVKQLPGAPVYIDNHILEVGDIVLFAKYSPDTHEIEGDKFVKTEIVMSVC